MFTATYRLPLGVVLFTSTCSGSATTSLESLPSILLSVWAGIGFFTFVLIGLWQTKFVEPVEDNPRQRKRLAFHRGLGMVIVFVIGCALSSVWQAIGGTTLAPFILAWCGREYLTLVHVVMALIVVGGGGTIALYLPDLIRLMTSKRARTSEHVSERHALLQDAS